MCFAESCYNVYVNVFILDSGHQDQDGCNLRVKAVFISVKHHLAEKTWMLLFSYHKASDVYG